MRVFVYYNLHKKTFSVKALDGSRKGRVVYHADEVLLSDCQFKVSEPGRQRVLSERRKNVHAGVVGTLEATTGEQTAAGRDCHCSDTGWAQSDKWTGRDADIADAVTSQGSQVSYNPYRSGKFYRKHDETTIEDAGIAYCSKEPQGKPTIFAH